MKTCVCLILFLLTAQIQFAQVKKEINPGLDDVFNIPEVGALIVQFKNTYKVQLVAPANVRQAPYKNIDLRKDDIILSVNGQSVKKIADIKDAYNKLQTGQDFKLGIKRSKLNLSIDIMKGDPKIFPQKKSPPPQVEQHFDNKVHVTGIDILIINVNQKPMINKFFNKDNAEVKKAGLSEGDLLTDMNNKPVKSFSEFKSAWEALSPGHSVYLRFNKNKFITFYK